MQKEVISDFKGKTVNLTLNNQKNVFGIILQIQDYFFTIETDIGIIEIKYENVFDVSETKVLKDLFIYVCKNQLLKCKGIRLISSKQKINWPCKYFKNYQCGIRKICNYNDLPLKIKNQFIDDMHSQIPVVGQISQKN